MKALAEEPSHCGGGCDAAPASGCRLGVPGKSTPQLQGNATNIKGFKYKSKTGIPAGLTDLKLQAGEAGKAKVQAKGKGAALALPALDLTLPVTIQLLVDDGLSTRCWQNTFTTFDEDTLEEFKAKGP